MSLARAHVVALAAALVVVALPAAVAAAPFSKPRSFVVTKRTGGAAAVDGSHFAAWGGGRGQVTVLDERTLARYLFGLGRDCDRVLPLSGGGGHFLVNCGVSGAAGAENHEYLLDAADGSATSLGDGRYALVGSQWLQGSGEDDFGRYVVYTNWHTGESITERVGEAGHARVPYDLDSTGLDQVAAPAGNFVVGSGHALERVGRSIHLLGWADGDRTLHKCAYSCSALSVKGGLALWTDGPGKLYGYAIGSGRSFRWRIPDDAVVRGSTERRVYYLTPRALDPQFFRFNAFRWR
jgi:hypothetical protein